jgi:hypothetical protein
MSYLLGWVPSIGSRDVRVKKASGIVGFQCQQRVHSAAIFIAALLPSLDRKPQRGRSFDNCLWRALHLTSDGIKCLRFRQCYQFAVVLHRPLSPSRCTHKINPISREQLCTRLRELT